jgi:hypothetical protein
MIQLEIQRNDRSLTIELPIDLGILSGELRNIGIREPMQNIPQSEFTLKPLNGFGERFMKLVKPEDSLWRIASCYNAPATLEHGARREMEGLIAAGRFRGLDHMADYLQYGPDTLDGLIRLTRGDRSVILPCSQINMLHCFGVEKPMGLTRLAEAELTPVSDLGERLMAELQPYSDTIATLNEACSLAWGGRDITATPTQTMESARMFQMPMDTEIMNFYCPLFVSQYNHDAEEYEAIDSVYLARNEDEIRAALRAWMDDKDGFAILSDSLQPKVASIDWEIERIGSEVYGKAVCELRIQLSAAEQDELAQWLSEDASDGLLENFGDYAIRTSDGDLFVSFWHCDIDSYMLPEDEFRTQVLEQNDVGQAFSGIRGLS